MWDRTRAIYDPNHCHFGSRPITNDFAGLVEAFAKRNRVDISEVRLFFFETKKMWDTMRREWLRGVDWSIPALK